MSEHMIEERIEKRGVVEVSFFDTTLRDGAQALPERYQFPVGSKPEIATAIASLGISSIEAGFPATPYDFEQVYEVASTVGQQKCIRQVWKNGKRTGDRSVFMPEIVGLSPAVPSHLESTMQALEPAMHPKVHTFIPTDAHHMAAKFPGKTPDEVYAMGMDAVRRAYREGYAVEFSAEAASTTESTFLERVVRGAVRAGASAVNVPDTVGQRDPFWMKEFYKQVIGWAREENDEVAVSAHNHNDLGNAVANSVALVRAAAEVGAQTGAVIPIQIEGTLCALGERAGNADLFSTAANIMQFADSMPAEVRYSFNPEQSVRVAHFIMNKAGLSVSRQAPVVGSDVNVHRSGIHSDGVLKGGHSTYSPFDPRAWGHEASARFEHGMYQGRAGRAALMQ